MQDPQPISASEIRAAASEGASAWPQWDLGDFPAVLQQRRDTSSLDPDVWRSRLRPADLYLAVAATRGVVSAVAQLQATYGADVDRVIRRFAGPRHPADDLRQGLWEALLVGQSPRLGSYAGLGFLQNWIRVASVRWCIDATRSGAQHRREAPQAELSAVDVTDDPELSFLKRTYRVHFREAFAEAVRGLQPAERTLLKLTYLHGLSIDALGGLFDVHRATAARRIERARRALLRGTRGCLAERLAVEDADLDSIMTLIESQMSVSLDRLLKSSSS